MALKLYNTLSQKLEELTPLEDAHVRMYTCGPTVYHHAHIGNFRTFMFQDLLRRYILHKGFRLTHVMNITDVEDKIIAQAHAQGITIQEYTAAYTEAFLQDMRTLRIQEPEIMPRATDHIREMTDLILALKKNGLTYERNGSTYFRIGEFPGYGRLSRVDLSHAEGGVQEDDEYSKEDPRDFVLWKARKPDEAWWESELGPGRPGWHIECSAMSMKYLGETFDIHCGGVDLIFPHHENEIAQSEGATGRPFVNHWVHGAHLIVEGEKMSKSRGNFYTLRDLLKKGHSPAAIRYLLSSVHYRKQLNFTFEGIDQAQSAIQRVNDFLQRLREIPDQRPDHSELKQRTAAARDAFEAGMDNDLNTSEALGALFGLIRETNMLLDKGEVGAGDRDRILSLFEDANQIYDVFQIEKPRLEDKKIGALIEERRQARTRRNYARADEIRDQLLQQGIILEDTKEGTRWKRLS